MTVEAAIYPSSPAKAPGSIAWPATRRIQSSAGMAASRAMDGPDRAQERLQARAPEMQLIREAQGGSRAAFDALVRQYEQQVLRLALHLTGSEHDAEDIYQEAFLKAFRYIGNFRFECSFYTWIYRIVTNLCLINCAAARRAEKTRRCWLITPAMRLTCWRRSRTIGRFQTRTGAGSQGAGRTDSGCAGQAYPARAHGF